MIGLGKPPKFNVFISETQLTVGNVNIVPVLSVTGIRWYQAILKNVSGAGQTIRIGIAPAYGAPIKGLTMGVNDVLLLEFFSHDLNAIASAAGALLDVLIYAS